jgi:ZIP family zinc transporter
MLEAALWGAAGASSLVVGALVGIRGHASSRGLGLVMGFGVGVLISALAFELTEEAYALGGADAVALGLAAGALAFFAGNRIVGRHGGRDRKRSRPSRGSHARGILLGSVLDAIRSPW